MTTAHLSTLELRLAAHLPCTTAALAAWYSRVWRGPEQRVQTLVWAALIAAAFAALAWLAPPSGPPLVRREIPDGARAWFGVLVLLIGTWAGYCAHRHIAAWLDRHWLAWCLCRRQIRNETIVIGLWRAEAATLKLLLLCVLAMRWVALSVPDALMLAELLCGGFALAFTVSYRRGLRPAAAVPEPRASAPAPAWSAIVCLQAARPWAWLMGTVVVALTVSTLAVMAVQAGHPHLLTAASVTAAGGCVLSQIRLNPGTAALGGLLAWTGASFWWCLARVLMLPLGVAMVLVLPIAIAALLLGRPLWMVATGLGVIASAWFVLVRALGDLTRMRHGRGEAFVLIHSLIPVALLMSLGPEESLALIGLHLGWLLWRGQRLWNGERHA